MGSTRVSRVLSVPALLRVIVDSLLTNHIINNGYLYANKKGENIKENYIINYHTYIYINFVEEIGGVLT